MITLDELLEVDYLDLGLIACVQSRDTWIRWVHSIEDVRDADRLKGGELVVSSGRWCADRAETDRFACALTRRGAAALGVTLDRTMHLPDVVEACERWRLPLIEIRSPTTCEVVSETAASLIVDRRSAVTTGSIERERLFLSTSGTGIQSTLDVLQRGVSHPVYLVTRGAVHLSSRGLAPSLDDLRPLRAACQRSARTQETTLSRGNVVTTFAVDRSATSSGSASARLVCACPRDEIDHHTLALFEQAALFLGLQLQHTDELRSVRRLGESELMRRIFNDEATRTETDAWVNALGIASQGAVTCFVITGLTARDNHIADFANALDDLADAVESPRISFQLDNEVGIAIIRAPDEITLETQRFRTMMGDQLARADAHMGTSSSVARSIAEIAGTFAEARQVAHLESLRHPEVAGVVLPQVAPLSALMLITDDQARDSLLSIFIQPLEDYDATHDSDLVTTLDAFLSSNGHWTETARQLGLHVNTLRYRISRIDEITGRDLSKMQDRVDFFVALRCRGGAADIAGR